MIVGNLVTDPAAQLFVSLADADAYLAPERHEAWMAASAEDREAALVRASRYIAVTYRLRADADMGVIGMATARLAASSARLDLFKPHDPAKAIKSAGAGDATVTFRDLPGGDNRLRFPWLDDMLSGQRAGRISGIGVFVA